MTYKGTISPNGSWEITCQCGEKYTASSGEVEAIRWVSHHMWACPKNESLKGIVEVLPLKFESYSIGGEVLHQHDMGGELVTGFLDPDGCELCAVAAG